MKFPVLEELKIAVVGLGYVGLPLALEFSKHFRKVVGYDISISRVEQLSNGLDVTNEIEESELTQLGAISFTCEIADLSSCNFFIVTVPTPINQDKTPDLGPLVKASESVGSILKSGDIVVYESTVYPGVTEEICMPVLSEMSGLNPDIDFCVGYSPERINPGDSLHKLKDLIKSQL